MADEPELALFSTPLRQRNVHTAGPREVHSKGHGHGRNPEDHNGRKQESNQPIKPIWAGLAYFHDRDRITDPC